MTATSSSMVSISAKVMRNAIPAEYASALEVGSRAYTSSWSRMIGNLGPNSYISKPKSERDDRFQLLHGDSQEFWKPPGQLRILRLKGVLLLL